MIIKSVRAHLPILILLQAVVFAAFWRTLSAPLWNPADFDILHDADILSRDPGLLFRHFGNLVSQPVLQLGFLAEYKLFGLDPTGYYAVNLVIHGLNAFVVYLLVNMLFPRQRMAVLASLLFACTVGSYGKILLSLANLEPLLLATFYLLVLYSLIRNDFRHQGRLGTPWFLFALGLFALAGLTKPASFSLLGCLLAYKFFFHEARERRAVFSADLVILIAVGILFAAAHQRLGHPARIAFSEDGGALRFTWISFKTIFRYLTLMLFPIQHSSSLVTHGSSFIHLLYDARTVIRVFLTLAIISYSFFGFVFGGRAVRFFIAWTYIAVLPFTAVDPSGRWLNLQYLYLVALGFCVILAAGAHGCAELLAARRHRRRLPYAIPALFLAAAIAVTYQLDAQNRRWARTPQTAELRAKLEAAVRAPLSDERSLRDQPPPASGAPDALQ